MTPKLANRVILTMISVSVALAVINTFFEKSYIGAMVCISSTSVFYYVYRNPKLMMATSWDEFGELFDNSRDKKYLGGTPTLNAVILAAVLYIWLV